MLEILEDRYGLRSTVITSQLAPALWHDYVAHPTLADAICDRIFTSRPSPRTQGRLDAESPRQTRAGGVARCLTTLMECLYGPSRGLGFT